MGDDNLTFELRQGKKNNTGAEEILKMQLCVFGVNSANGWFDKSRTFGDDVALLHSEVSEMLEAFRTDGLEDTTATNCKVVYDLPYTHEEISNMDDHICKPEGVGSEAADVLVRLLDMCERYNIDLVTEFWRKVEYNATRGYRHGNRQL